MNCNNVCNLVLQSDIVHQSVYELVHSEDREELQRQLMWNSFLPPESAGLSLQETLQPDHLQLLERSFTVRFRCLLDNTSGFLVSAFFSLSLLAQNILLYTYKPTAFTPFLIRNSILLTLEPLAIRLVKRITFRAFDPLWKLWTLILFFQLTFLGFLFTIIFIFIYNFWNYFLIYFIIHIIIYIYFLILLILNV